MVSTISICVKVLKYDSWIPFLLLLIYSHAVLSQNPITTNIGSIPPASSSLIGSHSPIYDLDGNLLPWKNMSHILDLEMNWFLQTPEENSYPYFFWMTFMDGNYQPLPERKDFIPATQNGMGILSYLKYFELHQHSPGSNRFLDLARRMGLYLIKETLTPNEGAYPLFPHSTGSRGQFPLPPNSGTQNDLPFEIQPDKGGIVGFALLQLSKVQKISETDRTLFLKNALHIARILVQNQVSGSLRQSPWPFRVDHRSGVARGLVSGNMVYILRLFDDLIEMGFQEFEESREALFKWIIHFQIPSAQDEGLLWVQFFEDHDSESNRTAWAPLNLARYFLEKKETLHPQWKEYSKILIEFVHRNFLSTYRGITVCGEQDHDRYPWGGILSTWSAVLALYSMEAQNLEYKKMAYQGLVLTLYAVDSDGAPRDLIWNKDRGGWLEDSHTDVVHNIIDAWKVYPEWRRMNPQ